MGHVKSKKVNFRWHSKFIIKKFLNDPEIQKKLLKEEVLGIIEEASKEEVEGLRRNVEAKWV